MTSTNINTSYTQTLYNILTLIKHFINLIFDYNNSIKAENENITIIKSVNKPIINIRPSNH